MDANLTSNIRNSEVGEAVVNINTYTTRVCIVITSISDINIPPCFFKLKLAALACCDVSFVLSNKLAKKYINSQLLLLTFSYGYFVLDEISKYCNLINHHCEFIDIKLIAKVVYLLTSENN